MKKKISVWAVLFMAVVLLFMYLPMLVVVLYSFNANEARNAMAFTGFTFKWYIELFTVTRGVGDAIINTLQLAAYSCGLSVVLGTLGAIGLTQQAQTGKVSRFSRFAEALTTAPLMIPEIILGMALMALFYLVDMPFGMLTLVLGHTTFCVPYILIVVKGRLSGMDPALAEAARDLGATPGRVMRDITLPLITPGILSGAFLALAMSLDDLIISYFVTGAGLNTLPLMIYSSVKTGVSLKINALCTLMLVVVFAACSVFLLRKPKKA